MTLTALRLERTYDHPADAVFAAWTRPEVLARWLHAGPDWTTPEVIVEPRVGGTIHVTMRDPDGNERGGGGDGHAEGWSLCLDNLTEAFA